VAWINQNSDDHTVVSDDVYNNRMSRKLKHINQVIRAPPTTAASRVFSNCASPVQEPLSITAAYIRMSMPVTNR
jgi:hypothetical protein